MKPTSDKYKSMKTKQDSTALAVSDSRFIEDDSESRRSTREEARVHIMSNDSSQPDPIDHRNQKKSYWFNGFKVEEEYDGPAASPERKSIIHFVCFCFQGLFF